MPLNLPDRLPAIELLKKENIFVMDTTRAHGQDIRPLRIAILNLMPIKITTETDFVRILSNSPLQIEIEFMKIKSHTSKNAPVEHMQAFYHDFDDMRHKKYDGFIITGAPLEQMEYEDVSYWAELQEVMNWAHSNVTSTLYICWAAFAGLYHFYGIPKQATPEKVFGVFRHHAIDPKLPIFRGFDDEFYVPHSRHITLPKDAVEAHPDLKIISESNEAGIHIVMARGGRDFFITGHSEYAPLTLDGEYRRDLSKNLPIHMPENYYRDNNADNPPIVRWRSTANLLFTNWLNYYVYQETPYNIEDIHD
ncbi:MAG: homoserine O-succinyltransferase [Bacteroidaceae bacterium]|nr:homoserine O-succinyltransferase [Bacteroidaceae bacterium]MBQ9177146.1 homoserine O-succinyltransferase [Bacteroidaceae bacterium]